MIRKADTRVFATVRHNLVRLVENEQAQTRCQYWAEIAHQRVGLFNGGDKDRRLVAREPIVRDPPVGAAIERRDGHLAAELRPKFGLDLASERP